MSRPSAPLALLYYLHSSGGGIPFGGWKDWCLTMFMRTEHRNNVQRGLRDDYALISLLTTGFQKTLNQGIGLLIEIWILTPIMGLVVPTKSKVGHPRQVQDCSLPFSLAKPTVNRQCLGPDQLAGYRQASAPLELESQSHGSVLQEAEYGCGYIKYK